MIGGPFPALGAPPLVAPFFLFLSSNLQPGSHFSLLPPLVAAMPETLPYPPEACYRSLPLAAVDVADDFLRLLHQGPPDPHLLATLREFGQLQPLLVLQQQQGPHHLLGGYRQFIALRALDADQVACQLLPPATPPFHCFALQILADLAGPQASPIAQAHLLRQARQVLGVQEQLRLLGLMGYKPQPYKLKELLALLSLDQAAVFALHRGTLSPKSAKLCLPLAAEEQQLLVEVITSHRLGGSKQQKLVEMVTELSRRHQQPITTLLQCRRPTAEATAADNPPQRLQALMQHLQEQCHPDETAAEQRFLALVQELHPPETVRIRHCLSFEDESLEVCLRLADVDSLRRQWPEIRKIVE